MIAMLLRCVSLALLLTCFVAPSHAQFEGFQVIPELSQFNSNTPDHGLKVSAGVRIAPGAKTGMLDVTVEMNETWHVYSLTQPDGGPLKSQIKLDASDQYRLLGSFSPNHPAEVHFVDLFGMDVEEFRGRVTWSVPIEVLGSASELKITGFVEGQVCADGGACVPFARDEAAFEATATDTLSSSVTQSITGFRLSGTHALIRSWLSAKEASPGDTIQLYVAFNPDPDWHVYAYEKLPPNIFQKPTLVQAELPADWSLGTAKSAAAIITEEGITDDAPIRYYEGPVTISVPISIASTAEAGEFDVSGHVAYQTCAKVCDRPTAVAWAAKIRVKADSSAEKKALGGVRFDSSPSKYDTVVALLEKNNQTGATSPSEEGPGEQVAANGTPGATPDSAKTLANLEFETDATKVERSLIGVLGLAFVGGFVLNFMPCVLPVIGLKILSFVDQAGSDRVKIFNLNLWYAFGMLTIFWILAVLAAAPALGLSENGLGWGEQFNYQGFAIPLVCVVFVMALSFLGVWEMPIPGFAMSSTASELSEKEGYSGAFFKGVVTTILATPCSAPGLAAAYAFAVNSGSPTLPFLIFTVMGLGMAIPYLIIGAFPSMIRFLPKPGAWMDTFKQFMGFVLLATVVFLMQNLTFQNLLPTVALLFGLWFACWWIGRVPLTATTSTRARAWAVAFAISLLAVGISFGRHLDAFGMTFTGLLGKAEQKYLVGVDRALSERGGANQSDIVPLAHSENSLPWTPFSTALLNESIASEHTILVDFTADW